MALWFRGRRGQLIDHLAADFAFLRAGAVGVAARAIKARQIGAIPFGERGGAWATWKESQKPPDGCSELRRCLFYVAKFNDGKGLTDRTIYAALK